MSRVLITGMGCVSPLGNSVEQLWSRLLRGESGIRRLTRIETGDLPTSIGGEVDTMDEPRFDIGQKAAWRKMDRASRFAVDAAQQAIRRAGLASDAVTDAAIIVGTGLSGLETLQRQTEVLLARGPRRVSPLTIPLLMPNAAAANISLTFGIRGPAWTVNGACASSGLAIVEAAESIRSGRFQRVITGGTESSLTRLGIAAFTRMGAMCTDSEACPERAMRPFDVTRNGMVMSEGAAMLVLESEASLKSRGGTALAELVGWRSTSDACHLVAPDPNATGLTDAIKGAFQRAHVSPESVAASTYVNAHGTATPLNDELETRALVKAFEQGAERLQVSSTKSMTGHLIGASGALESIVCVLAARSSHLPPTINLQHAAPECTLDYIPQRARKAPIDYALNSIMGFGGHNVALLMKRTAASGS